MGVLYLIGLGLWDENDMTRRAVSLAASCGNVFMEEYTSRLVGADPEAISKAIVPLARYRPGSAKTTSESIFNN